MNDEIFLYLFDLINIDLESMEPDDNDLLLASAAKEQLLISWEKNHPDSDFIDFKKECK